MSNRKKIFGVLLVFLLVSIFLFSSFFLFSKSIRGQEDTTGPVISGISVSTSDTSATITWTTDEPSTSSVDWGVTPINDFTVDDSTLVTSHSVTISSLSASTLYYFALFSTDAASNETISSGNTFTTSASSPAATAQPSSSSTSTTTTTKKEPPDTTAPSLALNINLSKSYVKAPALSGTVTDNKSVSAVEYSTDGGINWISTDLGEKSTKETTFNFFLGVLDDGNYTFLIRAKDSGGNISESKSYTLIIDRLPPQVGTTILSTGPQVFAPTKEGILITVAGLEQKLTLSAIGGPISLEVILGEKKFNLERNPESGLWSGNIKFDNPGVYDLTTKSIDGAKNETIQSLAKVAVVAAGKVSYFGRPVRNAEVSVYVFEPTMGAYILWDGEAFGQRNPQKTNENGNYSLFLSSGKYYLEARFGLIKLRSQIFNLDSPSIVNADLSGGILSVPLIANEINVNLTKGLPQDVKVESELIGQDFPGEQVAAGKEQIVSILATWLPDTAQQIQILEDLPDDVNVTVIAPQESKATVEIYKKRGRYALEILADPDGKLVEPLSIRFLPTHFFLDKDAKIKKVEFGVLDREELLESLR